MIGNKITNLPYVVSCRNALCWNGFPLNTGTIENMKKSLNLSLYITYAFLCAVIYSIPMLFLLINKQFEDVWLLFLGNSLFFLCVLFSIIHINKKLYENGNLGSLVLSGMYVTLAALLAIGLITLIAYAAFDLSSLHKTGDKATIQDAPANTDTGLVFMLFVCGLFVNLFVGAFASFVAAVTAKGRQTNENGKKARVTDDVTKTQPQS